MSDKETRRKRGAENLPLVGNVLRGVRERGEERKLQRQEIIQKIREAGVFGDDKEVERFIDTYESLGHYHFVRYIEALINLVGINILDLEKSEIERLAHLWIFRHGLD